MSADLTAARVKTDVVRSMPEPVTSLVRVAIESDAPQQLVATGHAALGKPLGLAGPAGEALARAPDSPAGDRALAIAQAAATNRLVAPPGWWIVAIARASSPFGYLAIGDRTSREDLTPELVGLLSELLGDQLQRIVLLRDRTASLLRQLACDAEASPARARHEAAVSGLDLADSYWPAILGWRGHAPPPEVVDALHREPDSGPRGALGVTLSGRTLLLHPGDGALDWFNEVAARARQVVPSAQPQVIVGERLLGLADLGAGVAELDALWRLGPRGEGDQPLVTVRQYALDLLLSCMADSPEAAEFVRQQIGPVIAWDQRYQTDFLTVLEAGLDIPRHDVAAARCFMHRNTFRHRFRHATTILGDTLEDPEVRLAVHIALKLRRLLSDGSSHGPADGEPGLRRSPSQS